ncbi:glutaredoxin family protein [Rhodoluna sp.]|jgi:glutaredoxin|uniref:glutaredoxin family protein n=1 Tax=Rhodoluna sp. TaxID=1969481 RepID=UPI0025FB9C60|nr:glutaredoxin family protein [Rhodoluna sp.]
MADVTYYGADWCVDCRRSKALLNRLAVEYDTKDVSESAELASEAENIAGRKNIPVILFADGHFLVEPSDKDLEAALAERNLA